MSKQIIESENHSGLDGYFKSCNGTLIEMIKKYMGDSSRLKFNRLRQESSGDSDLEQSHPQDFEGVKKNFKVLIANDEAM